MPSKRLVGLVVLLGLTISFTPAFALTELERATISDQRLENAFGVKIGNNVNAEQQFQISADITNHQEKSQNFVYLVQIKNDQGLVEKLSWVSAGLAPNQKFTASLSWIPATPGIYTAEIFVWEGLINHKALTEYTTLQINVS